MKFLPEEGYKRFFVIFIYSIIGAALVYVVFRYLFPAVLPFLIAFPAAALLRRPTLAIARHTRMPRKIIASLLAILFVSLLLGGIAALIWILASEVGDFAKSIISGETTLLENLQNILSRISEESCQNILDNVLADPEARLTVIPETRGKGFVMGHTPDFLEVRVLTDCPLSGEELTVRPLGREGEILICEPMPD